MTSAVRAAHAAADVEAGVEQHRHEPLGLAHTDWMITVELVHRGIRHGCSEPALTLGANEPVVAGHDDCGGHVDLADPVV